MMRSLVTIGQRLLRRAVVRRGANGCTSRRETRTNQWRLLIQQTPGLQITVVTHKNTSPKTTREEETLTKRSTTPKNLMLTTSLPARLGYTILPTSSLRRPSAPTTRANTSLSECLHDEHEFAHRLPMFARNASNRGD